MNEVYVCNHLHFMLLRVVYRKETMLLHLELRSVLDHFLD